MFRSDGRRDPHRSASERREPVKTFANLDDFTSATGTELGPTEWTLVDQNRVNLFADATDDHQLDSRRPGARRSRTFRSHDRSRPPDPVSAAALPTPALRCRGRGHGD